MTLLTSRVGGNADVFPDILLLYVSDGSRVLDMTWGRGVFWKNVTVAYARTTVDNATPADVCADFTRLPFGDSSFDACVLDPPYMHGGATVKASINAPYRNQNTSHESVIRLYVGGFLEAARVLRQGGRLITKCQDEIESGRQHLSHVELLQTLEVLGFKTLDLFVLVQTTTPAIREPVQKTARKNHSYFIVSEFRR